MQYKAVFFDLDGTLLPLDQDYFIETYFKALSGYMAHHGYEAKSYCDAVMKATYSMMKNDGSRTNEAVFWEEYCSIFGDKAREDEPVLEEFYHTNFQSVKAVTHADPDSAKTVGLLKGKNIPVILATNPVFPSIATESRIRWAGLDPADFEMITTYDNINYCKPNPGYYKELCRRMGLAPEDCVMVGNDVDDDMIAETIGMKVFLLTDNLINRHSADISVYPHGGFAELREFLEV